MLIKYVILSMNFPPFKSICGVTYLYNSATDHFQIEFFPYGTPPGTGSNDTGLKSV